MRGMKFKTKCRRDFYREDSFLVTVSLARDGPSCPALKKEDCLPRAIIENCSVRVSEHSS